VIGVRTVARPFLVAVLLMATVSAAMGDEAAGHEDTEQESTSLTTAATQGEDSTTGESGVQQAPALPGAQAISPGDRVYTADQSSNTVTVIDPSANGGQSQA
jgi:DNA-binding beta-propeller fold protein YncE